MASVKSGINKVGNSYYQTITTDEPDGSVGTTMYRVNADGSGGVPIYDVDKPAGSNTPVKSFDPNATEEEKKQLSDPNSQLSQARSQQITSSNPYGSNPTAEQQQNLNSAAGKQNQALNQTEVDDAKLTEALSKEVEGTRNEFKGAKGSAPLKYPLTLKNEFQDVMKFRMIKYSPKKFDQSQTNKDLNPFSDRRKVNDENTIGTVVLPIPNGISDMNSVTWGSDSLNPVQSNLYKIAEASITGGGSAGADAAANTAENVAANSQEVKTGIAAAFAEAATGTTNMLSRTKGAIYNPNMELLFQSPTLRPFTFTFKLSARNAEEAKAIRSIIRFFKQGMSPIRTQGQLFLKAPHTFQIEYLHKNKSHSYLNKFKECALQSFSVDYTPEGQYATFSDGAMVSYQIQMQFQELEPIFNDDYSTIDQNKDTEIGY